MIVGVTAHGREELVDVEDGQRDSKASWKELLMGLRRRGYKGGLYEALSLMRETGVEARQQRRWRRTIGSQHTLPVVPNLLNRQFMVATPNLA